METNARETVGVCPFCSQTGRPYCLGRDRLMHFVDGDFVYLKCQGCGSLFQSPLPTTEASLHFYPDQGYKPYAQTTHKRQDWEILDDLPLHGAIMDVGCGGGGALGDFLSEHPGWNATGIDFSQAALDQARRNLPGGVELIKGDAIGSLENLPDGSFDFIIAQDIIEHVNDPGALMAHLARLLKKTGELFMTSPNSNSLTMKLFRSWAYHLEAPRHLAIPSVKALRRLALDHGLEVAHIEGEKGGAMFWKSLPFSYAKAGWAYRLRLVRLNTWLMSFFYRKNLDCFSMVKLVMVKN